MAWAQSGYPWAGYAPNASDPASERTNALSLKDLLIAREASKDVVTL